MSLGFSLTFELDKAVLSGALAAISRKPGSSDSDWGSEIGINLKKARAYSSWLLYLGLRKMKERRLSPLGELILAEDPHLDNELSLQLLHYQICSNQNATVWWELANHVVPTMRAISTDQALQFLGSRGIGVTNSKNFHSDVRMFFNLYKVGHLFGELNYLRQSSDGAFIPNTIDARALLVAYVMYDQRAKHLLTSTTSVQDLMSQEGNVGRMFLFTESRLRQKASELEFRGMVKASRVADLDNVAYTFDGEPIDILRQCYQERD